MNELITGLMRLGLTEYEAKAYSALVAINEGGVATVSQESGIPRARVYDVMEKLSAKGFIEVSASKPLRYKAIEPGRVIPGMVAELKPVMDGVLAKLYESRKKAEASPTMVWLVSEERAIDVKIAELLQSAEKFVTLIAGSRALLLRIANSISKVSEVVSVVMIAERDAGTFKGLLGEAEIRRANRPLLIDDSRPRVFDYPSREGGKSFIIDLILVSDNGSLIVYRQNGRRLAMGIEDSIIDSWLRNSVREIAQSARRI